jgi:hypothetical protein
MLAYSKNEKIGLALVNRYTTPLMAELAKNIVSQFVPSLRISETSACCSDHQSFYSVGIPAIGFVEPDGYVVDPEYHSRNDLVYRPGYSLEQILEISKAILGCVGVFAGIEH